jgi:5-(carboxyamino)imidazole ribonucleotide synthase
MPARIPDDLKSSIRDIAIAATKSMDVVGLLCTEFFVSKSSFATGLPLGEFTLFINEFAPRPHNSGHVTMSACSVNQFEALARILLDIPLSTPQMLAPGYFCMGNLLGDTWLSQNITGAGDLDLSCLEAYPSVIDIVLYGKGEARPKRKMGHFTTYAPDAEKALLSANHFRNALTRAP